MSFSHDSLKVLMLVGRQGPISRTRIGKALDFTPSRVTRLSEGLLQSGLIHEIGHEKSTGGRRSTLLALREDNHVLCGIRISFSSVVQVMLLDLRANVIDEERFISPSDITPGELLDRIKLALEACYERQHGLKERVIGLGIGVSGLVNPIEGIVHSTHAFPQWQEVPLGEMLSERLSVPIYLENEVMMSTLAELWFGEGRACNNFLYFNFGPGVRMGVVINGDLYRGVTGNAGEVGHTTYDATGPICHCGNTGCLEVFVSSEALLEEARVAMRHHSRSLLIEMCAGRPENLDLHHIYRAAREQDRLALTLLRRLCRPLGLTMANMVNLFDTEQLIIGGSLAEAGEVVLEDFKEYIKRHSLPVMSRNVEVKLAAFDRSGTAIGGGALILQKVCEGIISV